ncbi:MAG TPA: SpoIIE family protein phosphatase [Terriglobales bacterium]|nr:SpoIIE family protein phosphatase [Terriglobales bacterium]
MATLEVSFLHNQLEQRKRRLEQAMALAPRNGSLVGLLHEVDSALDRMDKGTYGICETCHESIEQDRLLSDPLVCYCLDHLSEAQRNALQHDLDLAAQVQRNLLPKPNLRADGWETCYHYAPLGAVSGDYCDLIPSDGHLFFALGDVSGKGVSASMLMTHLHATFRSLTAASLTLGKIVTNANRILCESALAGQYATLVCGQAKPDGQVEIHNAGHLPAIVVGQGGVIRVESTGLPLGLFCEAEFSATRLQLDPGDTLFLFTDGLSEARREDDEYGVDRIMQMVRQQAGRSPSELLAACLDDLNNFAGRGSLSDDLTLLAIQRHAPRTQ